MMPKPSFLLFTLLSLSALAESTPSHARADRPAINSRQLSLTVVQSGVPAKGTHRMNSLAVTLRKMGDCDGRVTIKAYFFGRDVTSGEISLNGAKTREGEAVAGVGNTYVFESDEFVYAPEKTIPKTTAKGRDKVVPAKGVLPHGSLVQVFIKDELIATHATSQGFESVVKAAEAAAAKKVATKRPAKSKRAR